MKTYIARIYKDADSSFGVSFPDLPGCYATGETREEALEAAKISLREYAQSLSEDGEDMPPPRTLDETIASEGDEHAEAVGMAARLWVQIPLITASRAKRTNVSLDEDLLKAIDHHAHIAGINRSALLSRMAREWLEQTANAVTAPKASRKRRFASA